MALASFLNVRFEEISDFRSILRELNIIKHEKLDDFYVWVFEDGTLFTSRNPVTGYHFSKNMLHGVEMGNMGYVGIEGTDEFVNTITEALETKSTEHSGKYMGKRMYL